MSDKKFLEVTEENLREVYIKQNVRLTDLPELFGYSRGKLLSYMKKVSIFRDSSDKRTPIPLTSMKPFVSAGNSINEPSKKARAECREARYREVYDLYIFQNKSLVGCANHFGLTKSGFRRILSSYGIAKDPAAAEIARKKGFADLYADPERVASMVAKTRETSLERYGNNWYHNTASKEEMSVRYAIEESFPKLEFIQGSYGVIRRPGSGGLLQLDFYFPSISLAVEYNGLYWHDRDAYLEDLSNNTEYSREAIKDRLCAEKGIELVHIWSDDWKSDQDEVFGKLTENISERLEKVEINA